MASQSLYREYRPQRFAEVLGQDHVVRALTTSVREGRVGHAYLFSGPRGTGKTSTARILAKVLNCAAPVDGEPCGVCDSCVAVAAGTSFDVHEHDSASARGVNELKAILDTVHLGTPGRSKVYILDEVHMLTREAVAALLKTLEEPPPNVVFVLATTDPQKVPDTIRSRTQHFAFHLLAVDVLDRHVRDIATQAGLDVDDDVVAAVVREGRGSARDTLSALDRAAVGGLGESTSDVVDAIVEALAERDASAALTALALATAAGQDARTLAEQLVAALRDGFLTLFAPDLVALPPEAHAAVADRAQRIGRAGTTRAIESLGDALVEMRHAPDPRLLLDVVLVRLTRPEVDPSTAALVERIERLERRLAGGASGSSEPPAAQAAPAAPPPMRSVPTPTARTAAPEPAAAPASDDVPPSAPARQAPGGIAGARAALGSARGAAPPARPSVRPAATESPATAPAATAPAAESPATAPADEPAPAAVEHPVPPVPAPAPDPVPEPAQVAPLSGHTPDRDQLTLAWVDHVVTRLKPGTKGRFLAGRFVSVDGGVATFALPNAAHRDKCQPLRGEVEQALAAHFGVPVPLRLIADDAAGALDRTSRSPAPPEPDHEPLGLDDLVDAPAAEVRTPLDHLTEAFPGARLIED